jgi:hypothetical protein
MLPPPNGSQGYRQATITTWLSRTGEHAQTLHKYSLVLTAAGLHRVVASVLSLCASTPLTAGSAHTATSTRR